jgi:hypothetical protein
MLAPGMQPFDASSGLAITQVDSIRKLEEKLQRRIATR